MAEHKQGTMDITAQKKTFDGFVSFVTKSVIVILVLVIFMALVNA